MSLLSLPKKKPMSIPVLAPHPDSCVFLLCARAQTPKNMLSSCVQGEKRSMQETKKKTEPQPSPQKKQKQTMKKTNKQVKSSLKL